MVNASRLNHVVDRPQVALHFDGDGTGGDIVVFAGAARRAAPMTSPHHTRTTHSSPSTVTVCSG
jgi:hypothetical protein